MLNAAALTYVAAVVSTLLTLLYFLMRGWLLGGPGRLGRVSRYGGDDVPAVEALHVSVHDLSTDDPTDEPRRPQASAPGE